MSNIKANYTNFSPLIKNNTKQNMNILNSEFKIQNSFISNIEDLLQSKYEWIGTQEIVKLVLKNITEVIKKQAEILKDYEKFNTQKSITYEDIQLILKEFVHKNDLQFQLQNKLNKEDIKHLHFPKQDESSLILGYKFDEFQRQMIKTITNTVQQKDFDYLLTQLDQKVSTLEFNEALENQQNMLLQIQKKPNKPDLDKIFVKKSEIMGILNKKITNENAQQQSNEYVTKEEFEKALGKCANVNILEENTSNLRQTESLIKQFQNSFEQYKEENQLFKQDLAKKSQLEGLMKQIEQENQKNQQENQICLKKIDQIEIGVKKIQEQPTQQNEKIVDLNQEQINKSIAQIQENLNNFNKKSEEMDQFVLSFAQKHSQILENIENLKNQFTQNNQQLQQNNSENNQNNLLQQKQENFLKDFQVKIQQQDAQIQNIIQEQNKFINKDTFEQNQTKINSFQNQIENELKQQKVFFSQFNEQMAKQIDELAKNKPNIQENNKLIQQKNENNAKFQSLSEQIQTHRDETFKKIQEIHQTLKNKTDSFELNNALIDIYRDVEKKANNDNFVCFVKEQSLLNDIHSEQNIMAKWNLKAANSAVQWSDQLFNSMPDNFIWKQNTTQITCINQGLYQVILFILCEQAQNPSAVYLVVNNEKIQINYNKKIVYNGQIGSTLYDFLVLPEKAKISVSLEGGNIKAEGFLRIKRF